MSTTRHGTLTADTVETVDVMVPDHGTIVVHMVSGTGPIYFTIDGTTPTAAGEGTLVVHANLPVRQIKLSSTATPNGVLSVKLISATTDAYCVEVH